VLILAFLALCIWPDRLADGGVILSTSVHSSVCPSMCYQTCERNILKTSELITMPFGISGWSTGQGHESITFGVRRSKVKVTRGQS